MNRKKFITLITSLSCLFSFASLNASADTSYVDGTYTGSSMGLNADITVEVTISGGEISDIKIVSTEDDEPYITDAQAVIDRIISAQNTDVDTVSGATYSSKGIIGAVKEALSSAEAPVEEETQPETEAETEKETEAETETEDTSSNDDDSDSKDETTKSSSDDTSSNDDDNTSSTTVNNSSNSNDTNDTIATESTATQTGDKGLIGIFATAIICGLATFGISKVKKNAKK